MGTHLRVMYIHEQMSMELCVQQFLQQIWSGLPDGLFLNQKYQNG
jgi:hypothetical protein